ncbi:DUF6328 family protein [Nitrosovibrio tenuis]|nr:DUF6328 family protein [Nitrosovibrio tenuis]
MRISPLPTDTQASDRTEELPLSKAAELLLEECRMVLPGIQALFGFQLIAVFNDGFSQMLTSSEQNLHLFALSLTAIAIAFVMTPAAFHRQTGTKKVTEQFIWLCHASIALGHAASANGFMRGLLSDRENNRGEPVSIVAGVCGGRMLYSLVVHSSPDEQEVKNRVRTRSGSLSLARLFFLPGLLQ